MALDPKMLNSLVRWVQPADFLRCTPCEGGTLRVTLTLVSEPELVRPACPKLHTFFGQEHIDIVRNCDTSFGYERPHQHSESPNC
jgi:hypothetical protein